MGLIEGDHFDDHECLDLLGRTRFGRVGLSISAVPAVIPIHYGVRSEGIVLACSVDQVAKAMEGAIVALQSDGIDEDFRKRWTVLAIGPSRRVAPHETGSTPSLSRLSTHDWEIIHAAPHLFWLQPEVFSGRWLDTL